MKKRVMVYYNLHKHKFSIQYKNKVILHTDYVKLSDVEFRVRQGGRKKVLEEKRKNVHAFVIGNLLDYGDLNSINNSEEPNNKIITYNPYKYDSFVNKQTKQPIYRANEVDMINGINKIFLIS